MMNSKKHTYPFFILLFFFFLLPPNFIIIDLGGKYGLRSDVLIFLVMIYILVSFIKITGLKFYLDNSSKKILGGYIWIAIYLAISSILVYSNNIYFLSKIYSVFIKNLFIGSLMFLIVLSPQINLEIVENALVKVAFIYAFSSLFLYFGFMFGVISRNTEYFSSINETFHRGLFLGYINLVINGIPRNQSWFTEASQFGQFLMIPLFISGQKFLMSRQIKDVIIFFTILVAFILTFSLANYFGLLAALAVYQVIRNMKQKKRFSFVSINLSIIFLFGIYYASNYIYDLADTKVGTSVFSKQVKEHIEDREDRITFAFEVIMDKPFGDISYRESSGVYLAKNRTALGMIAINTGFPGTILVAFIFIYFFRDYFRAFYSFPNYKAQNIGFLAFFIAHWWYGDWVGYFFIFNLALTIKSFSSIEQESKSVSCFT